VEKHTLKESAILNELERYNDDELFYKQCYSLRDDKTALNSYIRTFSIAELESRSLLIPEGVFPDLRSPLSGNSGIVLSSENMPFKMTEEHLWASVADRDVFLQKHNRYSPVF